jgi:hypothetical protein
LLVQSKVAKRKDTLHTALIQRFSLLSRVLRRGFPAPLRKTRGILAAPLRAILDKSCDARGGKKGSFKIMLSSFVHFADFLD